ncbi:hypothetical protein Xoosp13_33 [Xanthomonas phage Xoo-sp13]|nr:hypothetical protein Xoosp13_33 [Xanthomonas phage Xoo-sp13]
MPSFMYAEGMSQSMDYAARCLTAMAMSLKDAGIPCTVSTMID